MNNRRIWLGETVEWRADENAPPRLFGYAAVFNKVADLGYLREEIMPGAFTRALTEQQDVRALVDHNASMILGRTKAGTLLLTEDAKGLRVEIMPPETTVGRDTVQSIQRGDLDQMSFSFSIRKSTWRNVEGETPLRQVEDVDLYDVSVVAYPAYEETSISVRSQLQAEVEAWRKQRLEPCGFAEVFERGMRYRF